MNRFAYQEARLGESETFVSRDRNVKIYDGDQKTEFADGEVVLTTHRLFWGRPGEIARAAVTLCLPLSYVVSLSEETTASNFFGRKTRIIMHLRPPNPNKAPGPLDTSRAAHIKLSGKNGLSVEFHSALRETLSARVWEISLASETIVRGAESVANVSDRLARIQKRTGIGGIERNLEAKAKATDENIALAFQDLSVLMAMAKDMVGLSKNISSKIREQKGEISDDETVRFKSYLLSLGIDDPVTRDNFTSNTAYFNSLAQQICEMLLDPIEEHGGMMSLADVYCRVNRARGFELLSPEDLLHACEQLNGPIKLRRFPSGAMVLQLESQDDELIAIDTSEKVREAESLAVEELAKQLGISLLLAKERLLVAERLGKVCRDESVEGLRFYANLLLFRDID
ncbi:vacuolar protein-sorting-associated protein 36 [Drosophila grimshawi]|uniref:Vacuolar protein-sorting-associated protein 36 n=1 Tax=Drosophila grimshawi TaxID=7222 RepID=B4J2Z0_DROGR|nr:vacuolar protein-sorting-associated protein 36 [Drosophila grimshawi]EDV97160.1 GH16680 [Drosophila grimshawi]